MSKPLNEEKYSTLERQIAVPYSNHMTPKENSRFGNVDETINYTIQMQLRNEMSEQMIDEFINDFKEKLEMTKKYHSDPTKVLKKFKNLTGVDLEEIVYNKDCYKKFKINR